MDSYLSDPEAHADAARNPTLAGGPFMRYETDRSHEIAALRETTCCERPRLVELSGAIAELEAIVDRSGPAPLLTRRIGSSGRCVSAGLARKDYSARRKRF
jgi:hypothetical protein